jgi:hypothetical protein
MVLKLGPAAIAGPSFLIQNSLVACRSLRKAEKYKEDNLATRL